MCQCRTGFIDHLQIAPLILVSLAPARKREITTDAAARADLVHHGAMHLLWPHPQIKKGRPLEIIMGHHLLIHQRGAQCHHLHGASQWIDIQQVAVAMFELGRAIAMQHGLLSRLIIEETQRRMLTIGGAAQHFGSLGPHRVVEHRTIEVARQIGQILRRSLSHFATTRAHRRCSLPHCYIIHVDAIMARRKGPASILRRHRHKFSRQ
ncbi:hypothetical protein FF80_02804 [Devosia sp. LC5]|nr:hypothetical protein FF80_02804 [Devosia sp. LC5]